MTTVLINGAFSPLGRRLVERLVPAGVDRVVAVGPRLDAIAPGDLEVVATTADALPADGGSVDVVILAAGSGPDLDGSRLGGVDLDGVAALLADLDGHTVGRVVVVSSAMVYGAWPNNDLPLTEESVLRPSPGCRFAADKAELERMVTEWGDANPAASVAVLRPTLTIAGDAASVDWLERSLWHVPTLRLGDADPPAQFLLLEDLVEAVVHVWSTGGNGVFNVAPDGWLTAARQVELAGRGGRRRVPAPLSGLVARVRWQLELSSTPPEMLPYAMWPWVVAADRIRATGWAPGSSNEEAFVLGNRAGFWASLPARRRQEAALAGLVAALVGVVVGVVGGVRRRSSRR